MKIYLHDQLPFIRDLDHFMFIILDFAELPFKMEHRRVLRFYSRVLRVRRWILRVRRRILRFYNTFRHYDTTVFIAVKKYILRQKHLHQLLLLGSQIRTADHATPLGNIVQILFYPASRAKHTKIRNGFCIHVYTSESSLCSTSSTYSDLNTSLI